MGSRHLEQDGGGWSTRVGGTGDGVLDMGWDTRHM